MPKASSENSVVFERDVKYFHKLVLEGIETHNNTNVTISIVEKTPVNKEKLTPNPEALENDIQIVV